MPMPRVLIAVALSCAGVAAFAGCGAGGPYRGPALIACLGHSGASYASETPDFIAAEAPTHGTITWARWYYHDGPDLVLAVWPTTADAKDAEERYRALVPIAVLGLERRGNVTLNWSAKDPTRRQAHAIAGCLSSQH